MLDTNVLISAALSPTGTSRQALLWIVAHGTLLMSEETLAELESRLARTKFERYLDGEDRLAYLALIREAATFVRITETVQASPDPDDDKFLSLSLSARADVLLSGDKKHLLPLHPFRGIPILTPAAFIEAAERLSRM